MYIQHNILRIYTVYLPVNSYSSLHMSHAYGFHRHGTLFLMTLIENLVFVFHNIMNFLSSFIRTYISNSRLIILYLDMYYRV